MEKPENKSPKPDENTPQTREELFKKRFREVITELGNSTRKDPVALRLIGSLATDLMKQGKVDKWEDLKAGLSAETYDILLKSFQEQGNQQAKKGNMKAAFAIEVLALSVISSTVRDDDHIIAGEVLLDNMIEDMIQLYRRNPVPPNTPTTRH